jgi:acetyl esterase/lipase
MKKITSLLFMMFFVAINAQIRIELPYTETGLEIYPEKTFDSFFGEGVFIDNVTKPEMHFYEAKGENITDKVMIICPGGGLFFSAYEKEGTLLAEKLSNNGINAIVLKYTLYPIDGNAQKWLNENWGSQDDIIKKAKKTLPFSVNDALNAIENIRNNSKKYKVDPNKIGLMGFSAGGAVTMEVSYKATEKNQPNFIAPIYPWMVIVEDQKVPDNRTPAFISCANNDGL